MELLAAIFGAGFAAGFFTGLAVLSAGLAAFAAGLADFAAGLASFAAGLASFAAGLAVLAARLAVFAAGLAVFAGGLAAFAAAGLAALAAAGLGLVATGLGLTFAFLIAVFLLAGCCERHHKQMTRLSLYTPYHVACDTKTTTVVQWRTACVRLHYCCEEHYLHVSQCSELVAVTMHRGC